MAAPQPWDCPICLRHVPAKVPECYCGYKRAAHARGSRSPGALASLGFALFALLGGAGLAFWLRPAPPPPPAASSVAPSPSPRPVRAPAQGSSVASVSTTLPAAWRALAIEPPATPSPAVVAATPGAGAPAGAAAESVDAQRRHGQEALERGLEALRPRVDDFWGLIRRFNDQCIRENTQVVGCNAARRDLKDGATRIAADVEALDEAARKSWVDPGVRRALREKNGLDENGVNGILKAAADAIGT